MNTQSRLASALAGSYEVKKEIGAGGMATVFLAHDIKHDRNVAVKVLHPDLGAALGSERFLSEIKTTAKLQHPHILPLIDSGVADSLLYYVMPYVAGESLRDKMEREGQLGVNEAIRISREVAGALDYAHRQGVIHRDIKPENILLNDGQALVADFGIALAVSAAGGARMTQTGLSLGTPQYMSPEQAMGDKAVDSRSDIYALGAVTYEMLTGEPPFSGTNVQAIVSKIMTQKPTPVSAVRDTVPPAVEDAVMVALSKLPADRFATAAEFSRALTEGTGGLRTSSTVPRVGPGRQTLDLIARRVGLPAIPVALAALGFAMWAWARPVPEAPTLRYTILLDSSDRLSAIGAAGTFAISADGSKIAYVGGPKNQIFVRNRNEFKSVALAGTEGATAPVFSPDGKQLAFGSFAYELRIIPVSGGATTLVTDSVMGRTQFAWGSDGFIYSSGRLRRGIFRIQAIAGAVPEPVTVLDSTANERAHFAPSVLPDGRAMVFRVSIGTVARARQMVAVHRFGERTHRLLFEGSSPHYLSPGYLAYMATNGSVMVVRFDAAALKPSGEPVSALEWTGGDGAPPSGLAVSQTGTLLFVGGGQGRSATLAWVTPTGNRTLVDSTFEAVSVGFPTISPDGRRVAFGGSDASGTTNIWVKQLDRGAATKVTTEGTNSDYASWTPDGQSVTYYSNAKDPNLSLFTKRGDGSGRAAEISAPDHPVESVWTPDGKWLIYRTSVTASRGKGDLFALQAGGSSRPVAIAATEAFEKNPAISPDGHWLAYSSSETGKFEIFVVPFPNSGEAKWAVSSDGGSEPAWSRDGRQLFYRNAVGMMIAVPVEKGASFNTGVRRELFSTSPYAWGAGHRYYDVAPDGRFLMVWVRPTPADEKIFVVDNWVTELNKKFK